MNAAVSSSSGNRVAWWRILSWQMYDFADTIYSMNVSSLYFSLFIASAFAKDSTDYGWALVIANLLVAVTSPLLGAMSDVTQRRLPFLRLFAILTAASTALIGIAPSYGWAVLLFAISYVAYNTAGNFYQALLPGLATPETISRVSGIGVGLGYVGSIFGVGSMLLLIHGEAMYPLAFPITAVLFLVIALPCLTVVPDFAPPTVKVKFDVAGAYRRVAHTIANARKYPGLWRFLVADFIYENAVAAVIGFMTPFSKTVAGLTDTQVQLFLMGATVFAVIMGMYFGRVVDRIGPKKSVLIMLAIWLVTLPLITLASSPMQLFPLGALAGVGLAAVWISSRTYLIALAPVEKSGEFFGLYSLSGKSAGVVGIFAWTLTVKLMQPGVGEAWALKSAVWVMWLFMVIGLWLVLGLPNVRPTKANVLDRSTQA
ncbi:MAG TPA: MFS transporter [Symbiobacteriaceae bacterium]|nr:MFS transporter [Symbiobacteriaceae bacterium]